MPAHPLEAVALLEERTRLVVLVLRDERLRAAKEILGVGRAIGSRPTGATSTIATSRASDRETRRTWSVQAPTTNVAELRTANRGSVTRAEAGDGGAAADAARRARDGRRARRRTRCCAGLALGGRAAPPTGGGARMPSEAGRERLRSATERRSRAAARPTNESSARSPRSSPRRGPATASDGVRRARQSRRPARARRGRARRRDRSRADARAERGRAGRRQIGPRAPVRDRGCGRARIARRARAGTPAP